MKSLRTVCVFFSFCVLTFALGACSTTSPEAKNYFNTFIVQVKGSAQTLLIDNNVDIGKRVPVANGDDVVVHGEYVWNDQGGLIHFTHHDPAHTHEDGWIELKGARYS